jgi:hypothetical protein
MIEEDIQDSLESIARTEVPSLVTLAIQSIDGLDFHDVHVSSIRAMLQAAFDLGAKRITSNKEKYYEMWHNTNASIISDEEWSQFCIDMLSDIMEESGQKELYYNKEQ